MATWTGWETQLLNAANLPTRASNVQFLHDWGLHTNSACANNPVDISRKQGSSTDCLKLTDNRNAQRYPNHTQAARAFATQLRSGNFPALLSAFEAGDPYSQGTLPNVMGDLLTWGSSSFERWLESQFGITPSGGGIGGGGGFSVTNTNVYRSWGDIETSVNRKLPTALHRIAFSQQSLLQTLAHKRRVRS